VKRHYETEEDPALGGTGPRPPRGQAFGQGECRPSIDPPAPLAYVGRGLITRGKPGRTRRGIKRWGPARANRRKKRQRAAAPETLAEPKARPCLARSRSLGRTGKGKSGSGPRPPKHWPSQRLVRASLARARSGEPEREKAAAGRGPRKRTGKGAAPARTSSERLRVHKDSGPAVRRLAAAPPAKGEARKREGCDPAPGSSGDRPLGLHGDGLVRRGVATGGRGVGGDEELESGLKG